MSVEYLPAGIACNLGCDYCYQEPMRDAGNISSPSAWNKAKAALIKQNAPFLLFGGEPLLAPIEHIEEAFAFGLEKFGQNGIQTNGSLITDKHIELFKKYKVYVGISCDGPGDLSEYRRARSGNADLTAKTIEAIETLCREDIPPSLIVTVHKMNGSLFGRQKLMYWFDELERMGIKHINLHALEVETGMDHLALNDAETVSAFHDLYIYSLKSDMHFQPFDDIRKLLLGDNNVSCIWNACDPLTTAAVQGVSRDGVLQNCGRTNKDGINWVKADEPSFKRYFILHHTPQEHGGCKDCKFFVLCKGNCPGTGINGDWRNRSIHCSMWFDLFDTIEREIISTCRMPVTREAGKMKDLLNKLLGIKDPSSINHGDSHGDNHGDSPHGDSNSNAKGVEVTWL